MLKERKGIKMGNNIIKQGVSIVSTNVVSEQDIAMMVEQEVSKEITRLNAQGKRVINISVGSAVKSVLGVKHHIALLWEEENS